MICIKVLGLIVLLVCGQASAKSEPLVIPLWSSMSGHLGKVFEHLCDDFNRSQTKYIIDPMYKGSYAEVLTSYVAAFRAHRPPPLVQIYEVGTATMLNPEGIIKPVYQILEQSGVDIDGSDILPAIRQYYSDSRGRLLAMPFNSSVALMYYNRDAFKKSKVTWPIITWPAVERASKQLLRAGYQCGFTTTYPSWTQLESFSAWHGLPFASQGNGFKGLDAKMLYNRTSQLKHLQTLVRWQKNNIFVYGGRDDSASSLFTSGKCPMMIQSSGAYMGLSQIVDFDLGVSSLPYWPSMRRGPQNTMIGGAALWASQGFDASIYRGIAQFFVFLAKPKQQARWQRESGYLPVSQAAWRLNKKAGIDTKMLAASIAVAEVNQQHTSEKHPGLRLGSYAQIRVINDAQLEAAFSGQVTAKQALDKAVARANFLLARFRGNVVVDSGRD